MTERYPPAKYYFNRELVAAIGKGDDDAIRGAIGGLAPSFVTEGISNRIKAHAFLQVLRRRLVAFDDGLELVVNLRLDEYTRTFLRSVTRDTRDAFYDRSGGPSNALTGDALLRRELATSPTAVALARQIAEIDVGELTPPEDIAKWMWNWRNYIVETLRECVHDYREQGPHTSRHREISLGGISIADPRGHDYRSVPLRNEVAG